MKCPKCHNDNKYDSLSCDFCMAELPMTSEREVEIANKRRLEKKSKFSQSITKLMGMLAALFVIIGIVFLIYILRS